MNTLPPNFNQNLSRVKVCLAFQSDPTVAAHAATVLYFKLLEINQKYQLLQGHDSRVPWLRRPQQVRSSI